MVQTVKCLPTMQETWVQSLGWEDALERAVATHSSTVAWKIPWIEVPGRLLSMGLQRVVHDWATWLHLLELQVALCYDLMSLQLCLGFLHEVSSFGKAVFSKCFLRILFASDFYRFPVLNQVVFPFYPLIDSKHVCLCSDLQNFLFHTGQKCEIFAALYQIL